LKYYAIHNNSSVVNTCHGRVNTRSVRWKSTNSSAVKECLNNVVPNLHNILDVKFNSIAVNACVDNFSILLNN
jgi:hypothetical protein